MAFIICSASFRVFLLSLIFATSGPFLALAAGWPTTGAWSPAAPWSASYDWSGFYGGAYFGGLRAVRDAAVGDCAASTFVCTAPRGRQADVDLGGGVTGGLAVGYNKQFGALVVGAEGEWGLAHLSGSASLPRVAQPNVEREKFGDLYGVLAFRAGVAASAFTQTPGADRVLVFAKIGAALANFRSAQIYTDGPTTLSYFTENLAATRPATGLAVGGGLEWALTQNMSLRVEDEYLDFAGKVNACGPGLEPNLGPPPNASPPTNVCSAGPAVGVTVVRIGFDYKIF